MTLKEIAYPSRYLSNKVRATAVVLLIIISLACFASSIPLIADMRRSVGLLMVHLYIAHNIYAVLYDKNLSIPMTQEFDEEDVGLQSGRFLLAGIGGLGSYLLVTLLYFI